MESKTSFFNKGIYKKTLKRFFPWSICYGLILLVSLPAITGIIYNDQTVYYADGTLYKNTLEELTSELMRYTSDMVPVMIVMIAAASLFAGALIFSYLFKERAANMMHALPVSREAHLITSVLAGLTLLLAPMILAEGITILMGALMGISAFAVLHAKLLAAFCLFTLLFFSIAVFCAMLSGHIITMPVLYLIVNFVSLWCWFLTGLVKNLFVFGYSMSGSVSRIPTYCSPLFMLCGSFCQAEYINQSSADDIVYEKVICSLDFKLVAIYTVCALVLLAVSLLLYKKRRIECAGDILAYKGTAWIFQILFATGTGVLFAALVYSFFDINFERLPYLTMALFLAGTSFGFFAGRMLIRKNFFIFRESAKGFFIFAACALALMLSVKFDLFGTAKKVPEADDVASISMDYAGTSIKSRENIKDILALHRQIVENRADIEARQKEEDSFEKMQCISIRYTLNSGSVLERVYLIPYNESELSDTSSVIWKFRQIESTPVFIKAYYLTEDFKPEDLSTATLYDYSENYMPVPEEDETWEDDDGSEEDQEISQEMYTGEPNYYTLSKEECLLLGEALLKDIEDGNLKVYYYDEKDLVVYCQELSYGIGTGDAFPGRYRNDYKYNSLTLNEKMTNTIKALKDMGVINEERPLTPIPDTESDPSDGYNYN